MTNRVLCAEFPISLNLNSKANLKATLVLARYHSAMSEISTELRAQIIVLVEEGYSQREIALRLNISKTGVQKTIARFKKHGTFKSLPRSGRKKCTSTRTDNLIHRLSKRNPHWTASKIRSELTFLPRLPCEDTIRRRLRIKFNLLSRWPANKPLLSKKNIRQRMEFCRKYRSWSLQNWRNVMFSDETIVRQFSKTGVRVWRPTGKRYSLKYLRPSVKHPLQIMVWGSISANGRAALSFIPPGTTMNGTCYLNILKEKLPMHMRIHSCRYFQHDGAPCHRVRAVSDFLRNERIQVLTPWPGSSPDMNPIENCWAVLKRKIAQRCSASLADLKKNILEMWTTEMTPEYCQKLINSMPSRIERVIAAKGQSIKY